MFALVLSVSTDDRDPDDARPSVWLQHHDLIFKADILPALVESLKKEVAELVASDTNKDGVVDESEAYKFKVANDGDRSNDKDTLEEKRQRDRARDSKMDEVCMFLCLLWLLVCLCVCLCASVPLCLCASASVFLGRLVVVHVPVNLALS